MSIEHQASSSTLALFHLRKVQLRAHFTDEEVDTFVK